MPARIALALGSGGARGYAHIGVINELQERGHEIVSVAGSSMGAVIGGSFAAGQLERYTEWVLGLSKRAVLQQVDPTLTSAGLVRAERVLVSMAELVGDRLIEELPIPFTAVAVDLLAGREVWLDKGPLDRAIRASIGIPGVITPAVVDGRIYVDGGVLNPVPVAPTASSDADVVVAVSMQGQRRTLPHEAARGRSGRRALSEWWERLGASAAELVGSDWTDVLASRGGSAQGRPASRSSTDEAPPEEAYPSVRMVEIMGLSLEATQAALTRYALAAHAPDLLITVPKDACRTLDFHRAAELIDLGRQLAREALDAAPLGRG